MCNNGMYVQEDLIKRLEAKFARRLEDQVHSLKKEMRAEMTFLEDKLRAEITLAEDRSGPEASEEASLSEASLSEAFPHEVVPPLEEESPLSTFVCTEKRLEVEFDADPPEVAESGRLGRAGAAS